MSKNKFLSNLKTAFLYFVISICVFEAVLRITGYLYLKKFYYDGQDRKFNTGINIICLGESSTAGLWVDFEDSYPKQLESKLREYYHNADINVIIPIHIGQNTSQISNRIKHYIKLYRPGLIILMAGINNAWSLGESNVVKFLNNSDNDTLKIKSLVMLNNSRTFKMLRFLYLKFIIKENSKHILANRYSFIGFPQFSRFPPQKWIYDFAITHKDSFVKMWRYDISNIIEESKKSNIRVLLMTYHINSNSYISIDEFISLAARENIPLIRNDDTFNAITKQESIKKYLLRDNWHPNKEGYSIIANNIFRYIKDQDVLNLNTTSSGQW
ncbi:MAG: hypothetical protein V1674_03960 [Candidatus Omnitrophota bacterium]